MPKNDATPNAVTVGACGIVLAPQPMADNRAMRVEMRNFKPPQPMVDNRGRRHRLGDGTREETPPCARQINVALWWRGTWLDSFIHIKCKLNAPKMSMSMSMSMSTLLSEISLPFLP